MTTMRVVGECFFWYRLTRVFPDKFNRAVKWLCVCASGHHGAVCGWTVISDSYLHCKYSYTATATVQLLSTWYRLVLLILHVIWHYVISGHLHGQGGPVPQCNITSGFVVKLLSCRLADTKSCCQWDNNTCKLSWICSLCASNTCYWCS